MEQKAVREEIISDRHFPVIARRTLIRGPQLIFGGHFHNQMEILYIRRGQMELCCNNVDYFFKAGEIAVLNPYDIHTAFNGNKPLYYYCFIIDPLFLSADAASACTLKYIQPYMAGAFRFPNKITETPFRAAAFENLLQECRWQKPGYELAAKSSLLQIFLDLYRSVPLIPLTSEEQEARKRRAERFQPLFLYMEQHFGENLTLEQMAAIVNYSPYHFNRLFRSFTGRTPTKYLRNLRMQKAVEFLREGASVSETALLCGFNSPNYFCKIFHEEFGYPPSTHRPHQPRS